MSVWVQVEAAFDDDCREEVENMARDCIELSVACEDDILDREIDSAEIWWVSSEW